MRIVYAVSSGDYSDYHVSCLFERLEDAKAYVELRLGGPQQWVIDGIELRPAGQDRWDPFIERFQLWDSVPHAAVGLSRRDWTEEELVGVSMQYGDGSIGPRQKDLTERPFDM
jgi:hypothetical protein